MKAKSSILKDVSLKVAYNLVNVLYHAESEALDSKQDDSFKVFKEECSDASAQHKYRLTKAKHEFTSSVSSYKATTKPLQRIVQELFKHGFEIANAELIKTRFKLTVTRGTFTFPGYLTVTSKEVRVDIYKDLTRPDTHLFQVRYTKLKGVRVKNKILSGLMKAVEYYGGQ